MPRTTQSKRPLDATPAAFRSTGQRGRTWEVNCWEPRLLFPGETKSLFDGDIVDGIVKSDNEDGTNRNELGTSRLSAGTDRMSLH